MKQFLIRYKFQVALAAILALAAFMRLFQLGQLPPGLHPDEAANGLDIFKILSGDHRAFYSTNGGRESLFFYLQSLGVMALGNTIVGLRIAPALIGTLAVGATYLWVSAWFNRRTGLIAALLMAVTPWAVIISRDGFRAGMVALIIPLSLWLLTKAFQTNKPVWYGLAGVALASGFYTYIAYRLFPVALVLMGLFVLAFRRKWLAGRAQHLVVLALAGAVTLVPIGLYAIQHPADVAGRPGGVSVFNPDLNKGNLVGTVLDTTSKTLLMFNVRGDENYRHGIGGQPELNIFVGLMFLLGIMVAAMRVRRLVYFGILAVFAAMLLPVILTAEGIPHALRGIGALPPVMALAALGISYMLGLWQGVFPLNSIARSSGTVAMMALLTMTIYHGYASYFIAWGSSPETHRAYNEDSVAMANYFNETAFSGKRFAIAGGYQMMTVEYLTHNKSQYQRVDTDKVDDVPLEPGQAKEFAIFRGERETVLKRLQLKYPNGQESPHYSTFNGEELFVTYRVPAQ